MNRHIIRCISIAAITLSFISVFLSACRHDEKKYRIGISQCTGDYWRVKTNDEIRREALFHDGVELEFRSADGDNGRQSSDIDYFADNGFDLIIVSPNESKAITPAVERAFDKGVPVVTFDRQIEGEKFSAHMEVDNRGLGMEVARYARAIMPDRMNIIELRGPDNASPARLRHEGFMSVADSAGGFNILSSVPAMWDDRIAERITDSLLRIYPATNLIYAHTDYMGIGAAKAARNLGRKDIKVVGIDGFAHVGIQAVKDSMLTATFLYPSDGEKLLRLGLAVLKGEKYDRVTRTAPLPPIDRKNADIILAQEALLSDETSKINSLHDKLIQFGSQYDSQKMLLYAACAIALLLVILLVMTLKAVKAHRRHQKTLCQKNAQLEAEKEKQHELYEQLKEATQSKLTFYTNVSHDLRTPLTLISGPVEEVSISGNLSPRDRSLMQVARKNVAILRRLTDQILDFRKYENGKADLRRSEVDLPALLRGWTSDFSEAARRRDIRLSDRIPASESFHMAVDVEKIERVFFNLMSNAFKHTRDNGRIEVSFSAEGELAGFSVRDNGTGIAPEEIEKIFDRFYQVDKSGGKGSGIGLALTRAFIELHGGEITVESEPGKGSLFKVTIPVCHCEAAAPVSATAIPAVEIESELSPAEVEHGEFSDDKPLLLVIDDNRDIQTLVTDLLKESYNIIYASDGACGLRMAVRYVPDIIICDVMMPVMDGMECVRLLKEEVTTSHIPVLMLTACSMDEQRAAGYENGADGYLSKPFSGKVLAAQCRSLLDNRRIIREIYGRGGVSGPKKKSVDSKGGHPLSQHSPCRVDNDFYAGFMDIVERNIGNADLSIEDIASAIGLSQSQLTRKIKALTNYTPVEIIRTVRLNKARTMLRGTDMSVSEIGFAVGFTSLAYFSKCYKSEFGEPPTATRL